MKEEGGGRESGVGGSGCNGGGLSGEEGERTTRKKEGKKEKKRNKNKAENREEKEVNEGEGGEAEGGGGVGEGGGGEDGRKRRPGGAGGGEEKLEGGGGVGSGGRTEMEAKSSAHRLPRLLEKQRKGFFDCPGGRHRGGAPGLKKRPKEGQLWGEAGGKGLQSKTGGNGLGQGEYCLSVPVTQGFR